LRWAREVHLRGEKSQTRGEKTPAAKTASSDGKEKHLLQRKREESKSMGTKGGSKVKNGNSEEDRTTWGGIQSGNS